MEDPEAEKVTSVHSLATMEQSADDNQPADLAAPEVDEAAGIVPQEEVASVSPVVEVRLHSSNSMEGEEADLLDNPAPRAELHTPVYAESEIVPGFEAAYRGEVSNQLPPHEEGSEALVWLLPEDGFEPHSLPLLEDEQVPTFEAVQVREDPHRVSCTEEAEVLASETLSFGVEHTTLVLLEGGEDSVLDAPSPRMEASLGPAQGGTELYDEGWKEEKTEPDIACAVVSGDIVEYDIEMDRDLTEATFNEFAGEAVEFTREAVEFAEEAVESAGEDVEAVCSGDIASENEFPPAVDMNRRGGKKRKRGRPSSKLQGTRFPSQKKDEEEVCFICFDGGDLVVCDRRGCPKVYHPSCVNREEAYFQSKGQWSCGWHLCSKCQKSASYKCYTCTYSLCKLCVNEEEFTCIRGNKGFCTACMTTILLMETNENAKKKKDGVDFNDRNCWEYLFKDYWFELKAKLSMNLDELTKSRTASKVCDLDSGNEESSDDGQGASSDRSSACHDESITSKNKLKLPRNTTCKRSRKAVQTEGLSPYEDTSRKRAKNLSRNATPDSLKKEEKAEVSAVHQEKSLMIKKKKRPRKTADGEDGTESEWPVHKYKSSIKKSKRRSRITDEKNDLLVDANKEQTTVAEYTDWASKELLEFISHVKKGDKSILSPYDVQELLLDYIKVNNLRDPRKKSQIICDAMLLTLFDKSRVAHFEMLKLLESHFLIKVSSPTSVENQEADKDPIQMGDEVGQDLTGLMITDKQRIARKIVESKPQTNLYCYAAIDAHNINLMYLRRSLMEDLIDDMSTFSEKVIGSFVRIRVTGSSQRQEVYRLVQVVGCGKAPEEYKTGRRTTDVMLEIINLDKKEVIAVDIISNQDFTEEECKRLRQSIKFGFISRLSVGEVQEKARVLQAVRISEHLESEKLRLTHLRDRASEKGRKKEHRECVEKLQLLSSPEEHMKRLSEVAQAHADPKMDPSYESPEDDGDEDEIKKGNPERPIQSTFKESELISHRKEGSCNWSGAPKTPNNVNASHTNDEQNSNVETKKIVAKVEALLDSKEPARESTLLPEPKLEASPAKVVSQPIADENEKLWHYKDPSGKIQGPFSVVQLRKWSKHFPSNLVIWRKSERQENSILLTDALAGNLEKDLPEWLPLNSVNLSTPSPSTIISSKIQETFTSLQNDKAVGNASCIDSTANLDNKRSIVSNDFYQVSRHEQVIVAHAVNSGSTQQASYQLIDVHNRPPVISSELDPRKKFLEEPSITRGNGDNIQKQDLASHHNSDISNNHVVKAQSDKLVDQSTSSTESNTVPEVSQCDHTSTMSQKRGVSDAKPIVESNFFESFSPQRSDSSTFPKPGPETPRSVNASTLMQKPVTFANSANGPPSHPGPQTIVPCNWNQPTNTIIAEQPVPSLNSTTMLSSASAGVSTSVNCLTMPLVSSDGSKPFSSPQMNNSMNAVNWNHQSTNTIIGEQPVPSLNSTTMLSGQIAGVSASVNGLTMPLVSSDGSKPFSSPQLNNSMNAVNYQQLNMSWGTGTTEVNNPGWQVQPQFQNLSNLAAAVGNILCSTGVQGGLVNTNVGWGMMPQGNMSMPWVVPPNSNIAWNQGPALPPQGNVSANFVRPPPQGNAPSYPLWNSPVQVNPNQNPTWPAPAAANTVQITHDNNAPPRGPSMENPSSSSTPMERPRERAFGSRDGGFRGAGPGYGPGRQPKNWASTGNAELPSRPPLELSGICFYFQKYGNCKRGASCKYIHSS